MALAIVPGMFLDNVGDVLDYKGALVGSSIAFLIPGLAILYIFKGGKNANDEERPSTEEALIRRDAPSPIMESAFRAPSLALYCR